MKNSVYIVACQYRTKSTNSFQCVLTAPQPFLWWSLLAGSFLLMAKKGNVMKLETDFRVKVATTNFRVYL